MSNKRLSFPCIALSNFNYSSVKVKSTIERLAKWMDSNMLRSEL